MIAARAEAGARQLTLVSVAHQIALAACAPAGLFDVDRSGAFDDAIARFAGKVEVVSDDELAAFYPRHWPAEIEVDTDGDTLRRRIVEAAGDPERPLGRREIDAKAHKVLDPLVGAAQAAEWLKLCHGALVEQADGRKLAVAFARGLHER
jgi:2-methylcitrate dehydratase PrpD